MTRERNAVFHPDQRATDFAQDIAHIRFDDGAAHVEHGPVLLVDDLDLQAVFGLFQLDLTAELGQGRIVGHHLGDFFLQGIDAHRIFARQFGARHLCADQFGGPLGVAAVHLPGRFAQVAPSSRQDAFAVAGTVAAHQGNLDRRGEIAGDTVEIAFGGGAQQPHQQEEGHHGRHEIGISDLPGATMGRVTTLFHPLDDDRLELFIGHRMSPPAPPAASPPQGGGAGSLAKPVLRRTGRPPAPPSASPPQGGGAGGLAKPVPRRPRFEAWLYGQVLDIHAENWKPLGARCICPEHPWNRLCRATGCAPPREAEGGWREATRGGVPIHPWNWLCQATGCAPPPEGEGG